MTLEVVRAAVIAPVSWRNGGGRTRELLALPAGAGWRLRISLADIDADGPFSAFDGVQRWFAVIEGGGVVLAFAHGERRLGVGSEPLCFDGATAPGCRLVAGPTRDLNLMLRAGARGRMERARSGVAWNANDPWRACFVGGRACWQGSADGAGGEGIELEPDSLLLGLPPGPCRLEAKGPEPMFWIAAEPGAWA